MKLIYTQGFNKIERLDFKPVIFNNIVQSFKTISEAMAEMGFEYDSPDNEVSSFTPLLWRSGTLYYVFRELILVSRCSRMQDVA